MANTYTNTYAFVGGRELTFKSLQYRVFFGIATKEEKNLYDTIIEISLPLEEFQNFSFTV